MSKLVVLFDSNVLYSAYLRNLLMHLTLGDLFKAKWSEEIHKEWIENVLVNNPHISRARLNKSKNLMNKYALDCIVDHYNDLIPSLSLPDENDRHVLAAAVKPKLLLLLVII